MLPPRVELLMFCTSFHDEKKYDVAIIKTIIIIIIEGGNSAFSLYNISGAYLECLQGLVC